MLQPRFPIEWRRHALYVCVLLTIPANKASSSRQIGFELRIFFLILLPTASNVHRMCPFLSLLVYLNKLNYSQSQIISIEPSQSSIFDCLTPLELAQLAKTSRAFRVAVEEYLQSTFSHHMLLRPFFADTTSFRAMQARTATLLSGTAVLDFLSRRNVTASALDVHVYPQHYTTVTTWLADAGYIPAQDQQADHASAINENSESRDDRRPSYDTRHHDFPSYDPRGPYRPIYARPSYGPHGSSASVRNRRPSRAGAPRPGILGHRW